MSSVFFGGQIQSSEKASGIKAEEESLTVLTGKYQKDQQILWVFFVCGSPHVHLWGAPHILVLFKKVRCFKQFGPVCSVLLNFLSDGVVCE